MDHSIWFPQKWPICILSVREQGGFSKPRPQRSMRRTQIAVERVWFPSCPLHAPLSQQGTLACAFMSACYFIACVPQPHLQWASPEGPYWLRPSIFKNELYHLYSQATGPEVEMKGFFGKSVVSAGVLLGRTREWVFSWSRYRWKDVLLKQACGRTRDEGIFANNMHVLVCLTCVIKVYLSRLHRKRNAPKKRLLVCWLAASLRFRWLGLMAEWCQLTQTHMEFC